MDQDVCQYQWVWAAAGTDAAYFRVAPRTLQMLSNAIVAQVAAAPWTLSPAAPQTEPQLQFKAGAVA
jgi:hypothetical protein